MLKKVLLKKMALLVATITLCSSSILTSQAATLAEEGAKQEIEFIQIQKDVNDFLEDKDLSLDLTQDTDITYSFVSTTGDEITINLKNEAVILPGSRMLSEKHPVTVGDWIYTYNVNVTRKASFTHKVYYNVSALASNGVQFRATNTTFNATPEQGYKLEDSSVYFSLDDQNWCQSKGYMTLKTSTADIYINIYSNIQMSRAGTTSDTKNKILISAWYDA